MFFSFSSTPVLTSSIDVVLVLSISWPTGSRSWPLAASGMELGFMSHHICVSNLTIIGSDNGLSPGRRQAIFWTNDGVLLIRPLGTNFSEILIEIQASSFRKMYLKMSSARAVDHNASQLPSIHIWFPEQGGNMATTMSWGFSDLWHQFCFTLLINKACMYYNHIPLLYIFNSQINAGFPFPLKYMYIVTVAEFCQPCYLNWKKMLTKLQVANAHSSLLYYCSQHFVVTNTTTIHWDGIITLLNWNIISFQ